MNSKTIKQYYDNNFDKLDFDAKFHYASRMYLWLGEKKYLKELTNLKSQFIGNNYKETRKLLKELKNSNNAGYVRQEDLRRKYLDKYENLSSYNRLLSKNLFIKTVYNEDISDHILELIKKDELVYLLKKMEKDHNAVAILSTYFVNYFYFSKFIFSQKKYNNKFVDPDFFLKIYKKEYNSKNKNEVELMIYLLTHVIICESDFYSKKINQENKPVLLKMICELEKLIEDKFGEISFDNKLEFLVCCKLLSYQSFLTEEIFNEVNSSVKGKTYIEDIYNNNFNRSQDPFSRFAEHTNVLYIMASSDYSQN
ncbi:hypothetical protein KAS31_02615 [Candidatus Parcubacteria bacterium]|nr:hypothetical protein [Candidatus Parcubacteria bacterium]